MLKAFLASKENVNVIKSPKLPKNVLTRETGTDSLKKIDINI